MIKILEFLKPTTTFGKVGFTLYIVGIVVYTVLYVVSLKFPTEYVMVELVLSTLFWFIGIVGLVMYTIYLAKKRRV